MKTIIVYSGKGGVGKTTTSANIAKMLAESGKKVYIVDGDINTPSMGVIFKTPTPSENIRVASTSFKYKGLIYFEKSIVRQFLKSAIEEIKIFNPDYVIIDTPPSITDVHINLIKTFKISGIIIVTQPSEISRTDVNRTAIFFTEKAPDAGVVVIENMVKGDSDTTYSWPLIARIPFVESFDGQEVYKIHNDLYKGIVDELGRIDLPDTLQEIKRNLLFDETVTVEDLPFEIRSHDIIIARGTSKSDIRFINLNTWDTIKEKLQEINDYALNDDAFLEWNTKDRIARLLKPFEYDEEAFFMITKAPNTEIDLFPGEIGKGTLFVAESYYGVPRIKYQTGKGEVVLFAHEVVPAGADEISLAISDGYTIISDGRYIPPRKSLEDVYNAFGGRVGMFENWEEKYDGLMSGVTKEFNPVSTTLKSKSENKREQRKKYAETGSV